MEDVVGFHVITLLCNSAFSVQDVEKLKNIIALLYLLICKNKIRLVQRNLNSKY